MEVLVLVLGATCVILIYVVLVLALRLHKLKKVYESRDATPPTPEGLAAITADAQTKAVSDKDVSPTGVQDADALTAMIVRSTDVVATLRDLKGRADERSVFGNLASLISRIDHDDFDELPTLKAVKLRRNGRWWLSTRDPKTKEIDTGCLIEIECVLNVNDDLMGRPWLPGQTLQGRLERVFAGVADIKPHAYSPDYLKDIVEPGSKGEWTCRIDLASVIENLPAPFRVPFAMQTNVDRGLACVDVLVPGPNHFAIVAGTDKELQRGAARSYAQRLALALAWAALASSPVLTRVVINCLESFDKPVILSVDAIPSAIEDLQARARKAGAFDLLLKDSPCVRVSPDVEGWLSPVQPFLTRNNSSVFPEDRWRVVEIDNTPPTTELASACGLTSIQDLAIMEKAGRVASWRAISNTLGATTQEAVSVLVGLERSTDDKTVALACRRVSQALVEGTCDVSNKDDLAKLFIDGSDLFVAARHSHELLMTDASPTELTSALERLGKVLDPLAQSGTYLDDQTTVHRYFNSCSERIWYNLAHIDDGREVVLVPDEYYMGHSDASRILAKLDRLDEALAHADELMRIAPVTPDAALVKVRCLERQTRFFEAAEVLTNAIGYASSTHEIALCLYRLAFMQWRLGRADLSVACYQRSISLSSEIAPQATRELEDLLSTDENLRRLTKDEVSALLEQEGIPVGRVDELRDLTLKAVRALTDAGIFSIAHSLASRLFELYRDDTLVDVARSLAKP